MKIQWYHIGLSICLVIAAFISLYASSEPDGLERVADDLGFLNEGDGNELIQSPMPDYTIPEIKGERLSASCAGVMGTLILFGSLWIIGGAMVNKDGKEIAR